MAKIIENQIKKNIPDFQPGDEVAVAMKASGESKRLQVFQGLVIGFNGKGINRTFTVRKQTFDVAVEKIFPLHSPLIKEIKVMRRGKVRRAKLYYMRDRYGKAAKVKEKR